MDGIMTILLTIVILVGVVTIIYIVNFNNLQELDIETFINKHSILYNKVAEGSYGKIFQ